MLLQGQMTDQIPQPLALIGNVKETTSEWSSWNQANWTGGYNSEAVKSWVKACELGDWKQLILFHLAVRSGTVFECWSHIHALVLLEE